MFLANKEILLHSISSGYFVEIISDIDPKLKTLEWDILNPDRLINLEINNKRRTSNIKSGDSEKE